MTDHLSMATRNDRGATGRPQRGTNGPPVPRLPAEAAWSLTQGDDEIERLRSQESLLILLNLGVLGLMIGIHLAFAPLVRTPMTLAVGLFAARMVMLTLELAWLRGSFGAAPQAPVRHYAWASIWVNTAFACFASLFSGVPHSHYVVLMVLPTLAAAFRPAWSDLIAVVVVAIVTMFVYVGVYQTVDSRDERIDEYFEVGTDALTYLAVAVVVRALASRLRAEHQRLRQSLRALEKTRDRLVAEEKLAAIGRLSTAIAHEIRNPVGMMASAVATARQADYAPPARDEMFAVVAAESSRLERLTDDFLSFARQAELQSRPTSVWTTLEYLAALVRPRASETGLQVTIECKVDQEICIDAALIHQALLNLARNALDATPAGGTISLGALAGADGGVELIVTNSGPPIAAEVLARLFEPFFTTKPRGTGLGLAIARKIAQAHGGDLRLTCNGPDQVRFSLMLPSTPAGLVDQHEVLHGANSDRG